MSELEQWTVQREIATKPRLWIWKVVQLLSNEHEQEQTGLVPYQQWESKVAGRTLEEKLCIREITCSTCSLLQNKLPALECMRASASEWVARTL